MRILKLLALTIALWGSLSCYGQKVGLVLSGGGASALAHVGVIKALEENQIPINYITGTSMGAFIGGLYASGYTPEEIESIVTADQFGNMLDGSLKKDFEFFFIFEEIN